MSNVHSKKNDETWFAYAERLIEGRKSGKYDLDKAEIYELLVEEKVSHDHARKMLCFLEKIFLKYETEKISNIDSIDFLNELELKKMEIQKEKEKNRTVKTELNKMLRQDARFEMFLDEVKDSIGNVEPPKFEELECNSSNGERIGIVGISDIHYSKQFKSANNVYSREICKERLNKLIGEIQEWVQERGLSYVHIVNTGDSLDGLLRRSQLKVLETGVIDSAIEFGRLMAEWLNQVSKITPLSYHHVPVANHTEIRFFNEKAGQFPDEDLEKVIINYVHDILQSNSRVVVPIYKDGFIDFEIFGKRIVACHGHQISKKNPYKVIQELQMILNLKIDILIVGHEHHEEVHSVGECKTGNIKVIKLPAIMGSDTYSDSLLTGAKAGSTFIELNELKKGLKLNEVILN